MLSKSNINPILRPVILALPLIRFSLVSGQETGDIVVATHDLSLRVPGKVVESVTAGTELVVEEMKIPATSSQSQ